MVSTWNEGSFHVEHFLARLLLCLVFLQYFPVFLQCFSSLSSYICIVKFHYLLTNMNEYKPTYLDPEVSFFDEASLRLAFWAAYSKRVASWAALFGSASLSQGSLF